MAASIEVIWLQLPIFTKKKKIDWKVELQTIGLELGTNQQFIVNSIKRVKKNIWPIRPFLNCRSNYLYSNLLQFTTFTTTQITTVYYNLLQ